MTKFILNIEEESNGFISVSKKSMFCNKMKNFRNILKA